MENILLVDDDPLTLALLATTLRQAGYTVVTAVSGLEALVAAEREAPDLAMLDIDLPDMSGLELAIKLRDLQGLPFMFLSAISDAHIVETAVEYGAVGYMVKPVDISSLMATLKASLARAEEIKRLRKTESHLTNALATGREISIATGVLMAHYRTDRHTAFDIMRSQARSQRKTIREIANAVLSAEETINQFHTAIQAKKKNV